MSQTTDPNVQDTDAADVGSRDLDSSGASGGSSAAWIVCGVVLAVLTVAIAVLVGSTTNRSAHWLVRQAPTLLQILAGVVYCVAAWWGHRIQPRKRHLVFIVVVACIMRAPMLLTPAIRDADYHRYLWDGAVTAAGRSPYRHSPQQVKDGQVTDPRLMDLAAEGAETLQRVHHPHLRTLYPPFVQGLFAAAHLVRPFDMVAWKVILLLFDALAGVVVVLLLVRASRPMIWSAVYLWNPLLVVETYYGGHLDLIVGAMLILFAWAVVQRRAVLAAVFLALGIGAKLWPVLMVLFLVRAGGKNFRTLRTAGLVLLILLAVMAVPYATAVMDPPTSGAVQYTHIWAGQGGVFLLIRKLAEWMRGALNLETDVRWIARLLAMHGLMIIATRQGLGRVKDASEVCGRMALVALWMLLLSPMLWPWYYVALPALAAVSPRPALLIWTALLPVTYLLNGVVSQPVLGAILHGPVWVLLGVDRIRALRRRRATSQM